MAQTQIYILASGFCTAPPKLGTALWLDSLEKVLMLIELMNEREGEQSAAVAITYEYIPYTKYAARFSESHNLLARRR
jgi:hypothetical protein